MKIKLEQLMSFQSFSHKSYMDLHTKMRLKGMQRSLNETELRQVCWIKGTIEMLSQMGVDLSHVQFDFDEIDLSSSFED
jgi:hypothetical protein